MQVFQPHRAGQGWLFGSKLEYGSFLWHCLSVVKQAQAGWPRWAPTTEVLRGSGMLLVHAHVWPFEHACLSVLPESIN